VHSLVTRGCLITALRLSCEDHTAKFSQCLYGSTYTLCQLPCHAQAISRNSTLSHVQSFSDIKPHMIVLSRVLPLLGQDMGVSLATHVCPVLPQQTELCSPNPAIARALAVEHMSTCRGRSRGCVRATSRARPLAALAPWPTAARHALPVLRSSRAEVNTEYPFLVFLSCSDNLRSKTKARP